MHDLLRALALSALLCGVLRAGDEPTATSPDPSSELARALVQKRTAVERLANEIELEKAAERDALRSLAQQRADVERKLKALELESAELDRTLAEKTAAIEAREAPRRALKPLVLRHLDELVAYVRTALPFKTAEREQAVTDLQREVEADRVPPDQALGRLWSTIEDELRLTRDTGLYRQQLEVEGQPQLVDVAKLGMALLYVRTLDKRVGYVVHDGRAWKVVLVPDAAHRAMIQALFESLDKHVRQGFFPLPNPFAGQAPAGE